MFDIWWMFGYFIRNYLLFIKPRMGYYSQKNSISCEILLFQFPMPNLYL